MQEYPVGTKEYFVVDVKDRLGNITNLDDYDITFDVKFRETGDDKYTEEDASNESGTMRILCLIDTTDWDLGIYQLWTTIDAVPESPRLGPFEFRIL